LSFDIASALRRIKPQRRMARLARRPDAVLPFLAADTRPGPPLLLDTCVYVDILQRRAPSTMRGLLDASLVNHSAVVLGELTHLFGRLDPREADTAKVLARLADAVRGVPDHRLLSPSRRAFGEAGMLAGLMARLTGEEADPSARSNDCILYLQAIEAGCVLLTRNIRDFDFLDQLLPASRLLFYGQSA
jgi:predicted nucleic acid-binding protein